MRQCLTSPGTGYYTRSKPSGDQFGAKGDFVTSPEISQIFGELVGVWIISEWILQGRRSSGVALVELGPGRGTLMADILRTLNSAPQLLSALESIHMVEASPSLRESQHKLLCGENKLEWNESLSRHESTTISGKTIIWHDSFDAVPKGSFYIRIASNSRSRSTIHSSPRVFRCFTNQRISSQIHHSLCCNTRQEPATEPMARVSCLPYLEI